jgi:aspartate racemase
MLEKIKLGMLGLGSRSTLFYIKELNRHYNQKIGGYSTCPFLLLNTNFDTINSLLPNTSQELDILVQAPLNKLEQMDIKHMLIPNITLHETIDRLVIEKNIIHPIYLTVSKIKQNKWSKIVLFGSLYTMKSDYIPSIFNANGIEIELPTQEDLLFIDKVRKRIYTNRETDEFIAKYHLLIKKYTEKNPVVLACTELSIFNPTNNNNLLDMAQVQIVEAVKTVY